MRFIFDPWAYLRHLESIVPNHQLGMYTERWLVYHKDAVVNLWLKYLFNSDDPADCIGLDYFSWFCFMVSLYHHYLDQQVRGMIDDLTETR
jgi:hypothetical protein